MAQNNLEKTFQVYLLLKAIYINGKTKLCSIERQALSQLLGFSDQRPLLVHLNKLEGLGWIRKNNKTNTVLIISVGKIEYSKNNISTASVKCGISDISQIYGFIGGAIYSYLHKDFWRRVKRKRIVCIKGRTYHSLSSFFNYRNEYAPVALTGVNKLYDISIKKASTLKQAAAKHGYIKIKKSFSPVNLTRSEILLETKYIETPKHYRWINCKYQVQEIDQILPLIELCRRKERC